MSTDDEFEASLRRRLADLAESGDADHGWADPLPVARERAAAGVAPDDDPAVVTPLPARPARRRWLPGLAVAAVLLALVTGAGLGIHALSGTGSSGSASSADGAQAGGAAVDGGASCAVPGCDATVPAQPSSEVTATAGAGAGPGGTSGGAAGRCADPTTSSGPLADVATIRPSGIVGPRTTSGGTVAVPYQLTFATAGGSAQVRAARAALVVDSGICPATGVAQPDSVQVVPVEPGAGVSGSATFVAVDGSGNPLPPGDHQLVVVIPYSVDGSGVAQLVSTPVTVTVTS